MSRERIAKLEALLARVECRRNEPRLVPLVRGQLASANTNLTERAPPAAPAARIAPSPPTPVPAPLEAAMSQLAMDSAARRASSLPPPPTDAPPRAATPLPPSVEVARAPTEVLPAAPVRIAPLPPAPFDAAVKVVSQPRIDAPRSFGDLLTLSLSLRPK
jgi:hypothetical protein